MAKAREYEILAALRRPIVRQITAAYMNADGKDKKIVLFYT